MTIMAFIAVVLYSAFSTAMTIWERQNRESEEFQRMLLVSRLMEDDFHALRPYEFHWEQGKDFFFAAGAGTVFYVTANGFGASKRAGGDLFFTCLYTAPAGLVDADYETDQEGLALYMCKTDRPYMWLAEELHRFRNMDVDAQRDFVPEARVREASVFLMGGISEPLFAYAEAEPEVDVEELDLESEETESLAETEAAAEEEAATEETDTQAQGEEEDPWMPEPWLKENLPGYIEFTCVLEQGPFRARVVPRLLQPYKRRR